MQDEITPREFAETIVEIVGQLVLIPLFILIGIASIPAAIWRKAKRASRP